MVICFIPVLTAFDTYVYHEAMPSNPPKQFIHRNIHETNPELQKFLDRNNPKMYGQLNKKTLVKLFLEYRF